VFSVRGIRNVVVAAIVGGVLAGGLGMVGAQAKPQTFEPAQTIPMSSTGEYHAGDHHIGGHGPDPAPAGVDVHRVPTTDDLVAAETTSSGTTSTSSSSVPCYGDGVTGQRVQAVYVVPADRTDRYVDVSPLIRNYAANVDSIFNASAAETGGVRHVRWVTDASCQLDVAHVNITSTQDDTFAAMVSALQSKGFNRSDRKYLVWADTGVYCGVADMKSDDRADATNANNGGSMYARVDASCWGQTDATEAHELMHLMGGVQASAPHASAAGHCTDESDRMCYQDAAGVTLTYPCLASHEHLFDCNHDDYFSTAAPAGSYLASHWNSANNVYLEQADPGTTTGGSTGTTTGSTSTAPTTTTSSFSGSTSRKVPTVRYTIDAGAGDLAAVLSTSSKSAVTLSIVDSSGAVLAQSQAKGGVSVKAPVAAGRYFVDVSSSGSVSFSLAVTYTAP
jgi:hypothetical protein